MPQGPAESGIGSYIPSQRSVDYTNDIQDTGETVADSEAETSSVKIDHKFLKWFTKIAITTDDQLYDYFLDLDGTFFNADKIDTAKQNAKEKVQMAAFNLAREWNSSCSDSNEQKLERICDALKAISKHNLEVEIRQKCSKIER